MVTPAGVVVLTDRRLADRPLEDVVAAAIMGGARWIILRERDLARPARAALACRLRTLLAPVGGRDRDASCAAAGRPFLPQRG